MKNFDLPALGGGAGLRHEHFDQIIAQRPPFRWFEVISEEFMRYGGIVREKFEEILSHYQIIAHGVELSIGSTDPLNVAHVKELKDFAHRIKSPWVSDHLCFTMVDHTNLVDLMPLPFTQECVDNIVDRIRRVQDIVGLPFLIENVTRYVTVSDREMPENEFITRILEGADCGLLLDITNVLLNGQFHGYDPYEFIRSLPLERVGQVHLSGFEPSKDGKLIDSHDAPVPPEVWDLFKKTNALTGPSSVLVEWDAALPTVERLLQETVMADEVIFGSAKPKPAAAVHAS